jgi:hypothetical protein
MAETSNIAALADRIAKEIFVWLKWDYRPLQDSNWKCVLEKHNKKTHPSDIVFHYTDPYTGKVIYLNTDLKSYKADSITKGSIQKALESLNMSIECANISQGWQEKFLLPHDGTSEIVGLLFIYNHDNEFHTDLNQYIEKIKIQNLSIQRSNKIVIFGPKKIIDLLNIIYDIKSLVADDKMTRSAQYTFFYPDLVLSKAHGDPWSHAASIEAITGPWIIIKHRSINNSLKEGYLIYYMRDGSEVDEFVYFLDALSRFQMLLGGDLIRIRLVNPVENAKNNFDIAKDKYLKEWGSDEQRKKRLNEISIDSITVRETRISLTEIGMRQND